MKKTLLPFIMITAINYASDSTSVKAENLNKILEHQGITINIEHVDSLKKRNIKPEDYIFTATNNKEDTLYVTNKNIDNKPYVLVQDDEYKLATEIDNAFIGAKRINKKDYDTLETKVYPNPFNPSTKIEMDLPTNGTLEIMITDITGKQVSREIKNSRKGQQTYELKLDDVSSGIYLYNILFKAENSHNYIGSGKLLLTK